ncbi:FadR/GntR family transcriptional regulator [Actinoplanes solisilvae]|uniref:FadR/GntR family transcriptional regulator n=1 Tax=Actinoplanes solisilvae TaxID=2486853 RepID=UPI000FD71099|nr:FCD domain-containing protein [Actinoplanes solisilvae]
MPRLDRPVSLAEQVADQLRRRIADGEFPIGALLPTEHELSRELGVSRNSVREGLRSLVHAGLLGARAGYGTFVVATSDLAPALARRLARDRADDVAEVRLVLEREAARLAALRATPPQVQALRDALAARRTATDGREYAAADIAFHQLLLEASGNRLLAELHRGAGGVEQGLLGVVMTETHPATVVPGLPAVDAAHEALADAIAARDPAAACAAAEHMVRLINEQNALETTGEPPRGTN